MQYFITVRTRYRLPVFFSLKLKLWSDVFLSTTLRILTPCLRNVNNFHIHHGSIGISICKKQGRFYGFLFSTITLVDEVTCICLRFVWLFIIGYLSVSSYIYSSYIHQTQSIYLPNYHALKFLYKGRTKSKL